MYYHKILKKWIIDPLDIFLLSSLFGCLLASYLKNYLSEEEREKRLKRSIIKKSELTNQRKSSLKKLQLSCDQNTGSIFILLQHFLL